MMKFTLAASAVAMALAAGPAFAQTSPSPTAPPAAPMNPTTQQPAQTMPSQTMPAQPSHGAAATMPATGTPRFFTAMDADQWRASKFAGVDIYGVNNEKIGDVDDVILDRQGNIDAVVIGVGGFLGIGEKQVALPFDQVEWMTGDRTAAAGTAPARTDGSAAPANRTTAGAPAGTTSNTDVTGSTVRTGARMDYPSYGVLRMTKQDLQNAPTYRYGEDARNSTSAPSGSTAPKP